MRRRGARGTQHRTGPGRNPLSVRGSCDTQVFANPGDPLYPIQEIHMPDQQEPISPESTPQQDVQLRDADPVALTDLALNAINLGYQIYQGRKPPEDPPPPPPPSPPQVVLPPGVDANSEH